MTKRNASKLGRTRTLDRRELAAVAGGQAPKYEAFEMITLDVFIGGDMANMAKVFIGGDMGDMGIK